MKNKSAITFLTLLLACMVSILSVENVSAQEYGIFELTNESKQSKTAITKSNDRDGFYKLAQNLHTTAYINNNTISKIYGKGKVQKVTIGDSKSFGLLNNSDYNSVELITVTLKKQSDLNNKLDLTANNNLGKLKYVFIKCHFKCTADQIAKFITSNSNVRVFYSTETPS
ncbi:hypothetical protein [Hwangdonia lutea]|uniref:Uncharacterized protein n=1 Tax=Hwangdonia lutea TaxID=3075823 RepID=A0AA97EKF0_9FLAO|nr:hypothetical protein [Hwangdonia sp. SCSIO 19198]WOD43059.1 hypothetical protein RNZ46_13785 [Hwangdonia sp. SCSIO 19198]